MKFEQNDIALAFDEIYKNKGFNYLRPPDAYRIFVNLLSPTKGEKLLDVACGPGILLKLMVEQGTLAYGVDVSREAIHMCRAYCPEANVLVGNAESLPFEDETFDYVSCIGSLERMINREKAISELKRVARKGATFCIMVRNSNHFIWKLFMKPFKIYNKDAHQDAMNLNQWSDLFNSCGLKILAVHPDHWPYYRLRQMIPLWNRNIDYFKVRKFPLGLDNAYEFIFMLEKNV